MLRGFVAGLTGMAVALLCLPSAAHALVLHGPPAVFDFTNGSNSGVVDGNARIFSASSPYYGTFNVRVTGWSLEVVNGQTYVRDSKLMVYNGGLGVISGDDGNGDNNRHTIDNHTRRDFILLQFDREVKALTATFNTYGIYGGTRDSDATIKYGSLDQAWNSHLALNNQNVSVLNALFDGGWTSNGPSGTNSTRNINPDLHSGNFWLIGAAFDNPDWKKDGFKITNLAVIPEPETWAMLIAGFGLVGVAMRRRGSDSRRVTA